MPGMVRRLESDGDPIFDACDVGFELRHYC
jgi:hypothetical protein